MFTESQVSTKDTEENNRQKMEQCRCKNTHEKIQRTGGLFKCFLHVSSSPISALLLGIQCDCLTKTWLWSNEGI